LGETTKEATETIFKIDSYDKEPANRSVAHAKGTIFSLYSSATGNQSSIEKRLNEIRSKALVAEKLFSDLEKKIYVVIEYPRLEKTDLKGLSATAGGPVESLEE
jgi:hypothetical protein